MSDAIDYKELLKRYIFTVLEHEGVTFTSGIMGNIGPLKLSAEDCAEIDRLADEAEAEYQRRTRQAWSDPVSIPGALETHRYAVA